MKYLVLILFLTSICIGEWDNKRKVKFLNECVKLSAPILKDHLVVGELCECMLNRIIRFEINNKKLPAKKDIKTLLHECMRPKI